MTTTIKRALGKEGTPEEAEVERGLWGAEGTASAVPPEKLCHTLFCYSDHLTISSLANFPAATSAEYFNIHSYYTLTIENKAIG